MHIISIPMWVGSSNNYAYIVKDETTNEGVVIDPANPTEVLPVLEKEISGGSLKLKSILNTHHHWDHSGGNDKLRNVLGQLDVIGGKQCQGVTTTPQHGETLMIGAGIKVTALHTPCHTQDSICWLMEDGTEKVVFTGDTLFIGGCGRFFEGSAAEMHAALNTTLAGLPNETKVYPGHEYTKSNVAFSLKVMQNDALKRLETFANENSQTQGQFTIGDEKQHNVFMMVTDPAVQKATGKKDPIETMMALREMKNSS